jgi:hypothetical protein
MLPRSIVHLDVDAFFAAVEQAADAPTEWRLFFVDFSQKEFYFVTNVQSFDKDYGQRFVN